MSAKEMVIEKIRAAFEETAFPGESSLQGSFEGEEPYEEVAPFGAQEDWTAVNVELLDTHASALSFFSEAGFRFFLPAYLIADLNGQLSRADPLFQLTHGFFDFAVTLPVGNRIFTVNSGKSTLINPRRYGAATACDYARYRLSIFTREEAEAIVAYLELKRDLDPIGSDRPRIDAALETFWRARARTAPSADALRKHLADEKDYLDAIQSQAVADNDPP